MSVKLSLIPSINMGTSVPFSYSYVSLVPVSYPYACYLHYKGPPVNISAANDKDISKKLEKEIFGNQFLLREQDRELGIILFNAKPTLGKKTELILYGGPLEKVVESHPDAVFNVRGELEFLYGGNEIFSAKLDTSMSNTKKLPAELMDRLWRSIRWSNAPMYLVSDNLTFNAALRPDYPITQHFVYSLNNFELEISLPKPSNDWDTAGASGNPFLQDLHGNLLADDEHTDLTIVAADGTEIQCHKCFLTANSDVFKAMLTKENQTKESQTSRIVMEDDITGEGVHALLEFLYAFKTKCAEDNSKIALELLKTGHKYNIKALEVSMRNLFMEWPKNWVDNVEVALLLFTFVRNVEELKELKEKAFTVLKEHNKDLMESEFCKELFTKDLPAAMELFSVAMGYLKTGSGS